jgi:adenosine deaminase
MADSAKGETPAVDPFILNIPKAELHLHIEGTIEPEMLVKLAEKNKVRLPHQSVEKVREAYRFHNLQSFLDIYYAGARVLIDEADFYELTRAYLQKARRQQVKHVEIFFDPQTHTKRGVAFRSVVNGIRRALLEAEARGTMSARLIMCFLRDKGESSAMETLQQALPFGSWIAGVGLDSTEVGHPPKKFKTVFAAAREAGYRVVAHAGEEGPPDYIRQALLHLKAERIDHGVRCLEDPELVNKLAGRRTPLTVCPLSNVKLRVFPDITAHPLKRMLDQGLNVSVHSDDPAYFGGYIAENLQAARSALDLTHTDICQLAKNGFESAFISEEEKKLHLSSIDEFMSKNA